MTLNTPSELSFLTQWDTPTICNALELIVPGRRGYGFTVEQAVCLNPGLKPIVGYARTARCATRKPPEGNVQELADRRLAYYEYVAEAPHPTIAVVQDFETDPGAGAFWGEVQTNIHKRLGCVGTVTDGGIRDLDEMKEGGFNAFASDVLVSHGYIHIVDVNVPITVGGLTVNPGDLIVGDQHGVLEVPKEIAADLPEAVRKVEERERNIIDHCNSEDFDLETLKKLVSK
mgnify:CR=1 FL=1